MFRSQSAVILCQVMRAAVHLILFAIVFCISPAAAVANPLSLRLQQVEFVETPLADAVKYLQQRSAELDPQGRGLNIVVDPEVDLETTTSLALSDVTIGVCLICLAEQAGIDYRHDAHAFMLVPQGEGTLAQEERKERQNASGSQQAMRAKSLQMSQIEFNEAPLRDVLRFVAAKSREGTARNTSLNLVVDHKVDQDLPVTLRLNQVPASAVLNYIARTTGVEIRIEPWAIVIEPPGTKFYREARIKEAKEKLAANRPKLRSRGTAPKLGQPPNDPRSPAHPDYVHSANPDVSKRTNALNNVYKWKGGKWSFVRYGSGDQEERSLKTGSLGDRTR